MRRLTLCADDFALSRPISETIVELAQAGKINATTCMAVCQGWQADSTMLADLPDSCQVGLHLTLTDERPLTRMAQFAPDGRMPPVDPLTRRALLGALPLYEIGREIGAQFEAFRTALGRPPDFVDGHQHVHVLPRIRHLVLEQTRRRAPHAWLRNCTERLSAIHARPWKLKAIGSAGHCAGFAGAARAADLATNEGFAGHYDFASDYAQVFPAFLRRAGSDHLIMCHPGAGRAAGDTIAAARIKEADALRRLPIRRMAHDHGLEFAAP